MLLLLVIHAKKSWKNTVKNRRKQAVFVSKQPEEIKGWGYSDAGGATIHQLFAPFVPEGYDFISEVATILGESVAVLERDAQAVAETDTDSTENGATEGE